MHFVIIVAYLRIIVPFFICFVDICIKMVWLINRIEWGIFCGCLAPYVSSSRLVVGVPVWFAAVFSCVSSVARVRPRVFAVCM